MLVQKKIDSRKDGCAPENFFVATTGRITYTYNTWSIIFSNCGVLATVHYDCSHIVPFIQVFKGEMADAAESNKFKSARVKS